VLAPLNLNLKPVHIGVAAASSAAFTPASAAASPAAELCAYDAQCLPLTRCVSVFVRREEVTDDIAFDLTVAELKAIGLSFGAAKSFKKEAERLSAATTTIVAAQVTSTPTVVLSAVPASSSSGDGGSSGRVNKNISSSRTPPAPNAPYDDAECIGAVAALAAVNITVSKPLLV
jgi:hypothetical protein